MISRAKKIFLSLGIFLFGILFLISFSSASSGYMRSSPSYVSSAGVTSSLSSTLHRNACNSGQDFIVQINPFGCTPAVVRSDLLAEQNVPVFCELGATKLNPLIDVEAIESISFSGKYPSTISGVGFHPAQSALGVKGNLNKPVLNNIGYVVIVLEQQKNSSALPEFVQGNLTAKLKYDIQNAFGIGKTSFYLPLMDDETWEQEYKNYGFWQGRGFLRVEDIEENSAEIVLYDGELNRISAVELEKGKSSEKLSLPGFDCLANLNLKLEALENIDTYIQIKVNDEVYNVKQGEYFLDNKCRVTSFNDKGINQEAVVTCKTDDKTEKLNLKISPKVIMSYSISGGTEQKADYSAGDKLFEFGGNSYYLGYVGTKKKSTDKEDLFAVIVSSPEKVSTLSQKDLEGAARVAKNNEVSSTGIKAGAEKVAKDTSSASQEVWGYFSASKNFYVAYFDEPFQTEDKTLIVKILDVGSTTDVDLEGAQSDEKLAKEYYDKTLSDFEKVVKSYSSENYFEDTSLKLGEEALFEKINFSEKYKQLKTMQEYCEEFTTNYPKSILIGKVLTICNQNPFIASSPAVNKNSVLINNKAYTISFEGIYQPSKEDYSAEIYISRATKSGTIIGPEKIELGKNENYVVKAKKFMQEKDLNPLMISLEDLEVDSANVKVDDGSSNVVERAGDAIATQDNEDLKKDVALNIGNGYILTLTNVNLKKTARVSVNPNIENAGTEVNFGFKIGIEKNSIELSPDKTKKLIDKLNKTINDWNEKSDKLGKAIKGFKTACLGTSAALVVQGFFSNLGGKSIARQEVMRNENGWYKKCTEAVANKRPICNGGICSTLNECLTKNSDAIEKDVDIYYNSMKTQEDKIKQSEQAYTTTNGLTQERVIDDEKWCPTYFNENWKEQLKKDLTVKFGSEMVVSGEKVKVENFVSGLDCKTTSISELRALELNSKLSGGTTLDEGSKSALQSQISTIYSNTKQVNEVEELSKEFGGMQVDYFQSQRPKALITFTQDQKFGEVQDYFEDTEEYSIDANSNVRIIKDGMNGKEYFVVLNEDNTVKETYEIETLESGVLNIPAGSKVLNKVSTPQDSNPLKLGFQKVDAKSYSNKFIAVAGDTKPVVKYFETEPYKGLPALVPFDLQNGWYAATKQTLPTLGGIKPVDSSGKLTSFWVCNVGKDGIASFDSTTADDICEQVNFGTGQSTNQFPGLDTAQSSKIIREAQDAILQAQKQYPPKTKTVLINGKPFQVGSPAANIPDVQCQDFMSPKQCQLLFNVCDPVICPSSRCNFGGAFPVADVIQTGIVGSALLCLPNFREGIYVPVCLTGIKAGIDGFLSVLTSYRDCLQESLNTGQTVGICDEIYSIRLCDFFWRQAIPLAKLIIPKTLEFIAGQNVRGGGEYMGVQASWANAEKSVNYITQYYAADSYKAFKLRLSEGVTESVCKNFVSANYPDGGKIIDAITDPDSPPQFHGRFDEIPFTDAINPPISQYKVYYHVYAGKDSRAYYKIYLKGGFESSYYQDTNMNLYIASGYIEKGGYASETKDFTATSGYKQLCINVNGQEECGFKEVTTSAALDYIKDNYIASQANETKIKTESECVSGSASLYSGLNLNAQSAVEETINPAIYNRGIIRVCASANPGLGSDAKVGSNGSRWVEVGNCGNPKIKCWLDTSHLKEIINSNTIENSLLESVNKNYQQILQSEGSYLDDAGFKQAVIDVDSKEVASEKVQLIETILEKVFWNNQKGYLYLLRARAFSTMALDAKAIVDKRKSDEAQGLFVLENDASPTLGKKYAWTFMVSGTSYRIAFSKSDFAFLIKEAKGIELGDRDIGKIDLQSGKITLMSNLDEKDEVVKKIKWLSERYLFLIPLKQDPGFFKKVETITFDLIKENKLSGFEVKENVIYYLGEETKLYIKDGEIKYNVVVGRDISFAKITKTHSEYISGTQMSRIFWEFTKNVLSAIVVNGFGFDGSKFVLSSTNVDVNENDYNTGVGDEDNLLEMQLNSIKAEIDTGFLEILQGFETYKGILDFSKDDSEVQTIVNNAEMQIVSGEMKMSDAINSYLNSLSDSEKTKFTSQVDSIRGNYFTYFHDANSYMWKESDKLKNFQTSAYESNSADIDNIKKVLQEKKDLIVSKIEDIESLRYQDTSGECSVDITQEFVVEEEISLRDFAKKIFGFENLWPAFYYANVELFESVEPSKYIVISAEAKKSTAVLIPCIKLSENVEQIYVYKIINPPDTIQNLVKSSANLYKSSRDVNVYLETSYSAILNANPILSRLNEDTAFGDELKNKWISIPLSYPEVEETSTTDSALLTDLGKLQAEQKFIETSFSKMQNYVIEITDYKNSEHLDANDKAQISKKLEYIQLLADGLNDHKEGYDTFFSSKFVSDYQKDLSNFKNLLDMAVKYSAVYITSLSEPLEEYGRPDMIPFLESSESFSANLNALTESYDGIFSKLITELKKESSTDSTTSETEETWGYVNEDNLFVVEKDTTIDKIAKQVYGNENYWPILYYANKGLFNSNYKSLILSEYLRKDRDHLFVVDDLPIYSNLGSLGFRDIYVETLKPEDTETYEDYLQSNDLTKETFELFNPIMKGTKDSDFVSGFFIIPIE